MFRQHFVRLALFAIGCCVSIFIVSPLFGMSAQAWSVGAPVAAPTEPILEPQMRHLFLPAIQLQPTSTPTPSPSPSPTPTPTSTPPAPKAYSIPCDYFPSGPSDRDWVGCVDGGAYEMQRWNISFSMVACCAPPAEHYAIEANARLVQGEGDYRIGFDVVSLDNGGGYLFGINPRDGTYSLYRVDSSDWKGGVPLIDWTPSPHIQRDLATNQMRVERNQATITLSINGQQVASLEDSTYQHTGIGWTLYVRNYSQSNSVMQFSQIVALGWP